MGCLIPIIRYCPGLRCILYKIKRVLKMLSSHGGVRSPPYPLRINILTLNN